MEYVIKILLLGLFLLAAFGRNIFISSIFYWSLYPSMLLLIIFYWITKYYVSKRKNNKILNTNIKTSFFVGKVPTNVEEDLKRGRLSVINGEIKLVCRDKKNNYRIEDECKVSDLKSVGFGKVVGIRKGFTLYLKDGSFISYTNFLVCKKRELLFNILGWNKNDK